LPQERLSMRKFIEVVRLHSFGLTQRQIARSCSIAQSTVHEYLKVAAEAALGWPLPPGWNEQELEKALFRKPRLSAKVRQAVPPNFPAVRKQLQTHRNLTLQLLWEEYREGNPEGYSYSRFCELYHDWARTLDVVLRHEHRAGEKMFVDYAGDKIPIYDRKTGEIFYQASIFVAVLGASNYTFAEATESQELSCWIGSHIRALEFMGGVPEAVIPDNVKTGVKQACRYEPDLNPTYREMAEHYGLAVLPTRPYKPRDKAKVEAGVQIAQRWIVAALRHTRFFALADLNEAIGPLLDRLNQRPFRKRRDSCRRSLFEQLDRPALRTLPAERYVLAEWKKVRPNIDYHVEIDRHYYSVPYQLVGQELEARYTAATVEIFYHGVRVASHHRGLVAHAATTQHEHRPKSHQAHLEWTPSRLIQWAGTVGPATAQLVRIILESKPHPEMGYRACLGIMGLAKTYTATRLEAACQRALLLHAHSLNSLKSILKQSLDRQTVLELEVEKPGPRHENVRGATYYDPPHTPFLQ